MTLEIETLAKVEIAWTRERLTIKAPGYARVFVGDGDEVVVEVEPPESDEPFDAIPGAD